MDKKEQELVELFLRLEGLMRREMIRSWHNSHSSFNPHRGQGRIMSLLKIKDEISQKDLSYLLDMSKQALAELLSKLEAAGYITRYPSEEDKRIMIIRITDEGRAAADRMEQQGRESESVFSCLNNDEKTILRKYLERLISEGEKSMPDDMRHCRHARGRFRN